MGAFNTIHTGLLLLALTATSVYGSLSLAADSATSQQVIANRSPISAEKFKLFTKRFFTRKRQDLDYEKPPNSNLKSGAINELLLLTPKMEQRAEVRTSPVQLRKLVDSRQFSATIEPTTDGSGTVTSTIIGIVTKVLADVGQQVKTGEILAYISCPDLAEAQANYLNALAKLEETEAQIELISTRIKLVEYDLERLKTLNAEGIAAIKDVQLAQSKLASTQSEMAAAKSMKEAATASLYATKARLSSFGINSENIKYGNISELLPVRSPISGIVTQKSIRPGQMVGPGINGPGHAGKNSTVTWQQGHLFTIVDLSKVWAMLEVPQSEVSHLKLSMPITFTSEVAPGRTFRGKISKLGESFDPNWRTVGVRAEIMNSDYALKPGMLVIAHTIAEQPGGPVLVVPNSALESIRGKPVVYVKTNKHEYRLRFVTLGQRTGLFTEIVKGLQKNEHVVSNGAFFLKSESLRGTISGAK